MKTIIILEVSAEDGGTVTHEEAMDIAHECIQQTRNFARVTHGARVRVRSIMDDPSERTPPPYDASNERRGP